MHGLNIIQIALLVLFQSRPLGDGLSYQSNPDHALLNWNMLTMGSILAMVGVFHLFEKGQKFEEHLERLSHIYDALHRRLIGAIVTTGFAAGCCVLAVYVHRTAEFKVNQFYLEALVVVMGLTQLICAIAFGSSLMQTRMAKASRNDA